MSVPYPSPRRTLGRTISMDIKGFIPNSLVEWEGKLSSVVFLPRCNLRCRYCHAHHLILNPDQVENIPRFQILRYLAGQEGWVDGVVVSGGEPTLHGDGLLELVRQIRETGPQVMIETNGTRPEWIGRLLDEGLLGAIAMDLKAPLTAADYRRVTGVDVNVEDIRQSVQLVKESGLPHEFRITLVPGLVGRDELERMVPDLAGAAQVALQNFKPGLCLDAELHQVAPFAPAELDEFEQILTPLVGRVVVRGRDNAASSAGEGTRQAN